MSYESRFAEIESAQNSTLKHAVRLIGNNTALRQAGLAVAEGLHLADSLLRDASFEIDSIWVPKGLLNNPEWLGLAAISPVFDDPDTHFYLLNDQLFNKLSPLKTPTGPIVFFRPGKPNIELSLQHDVVYLDGVQDPGNVGTLLRNCAAAGIEQVASSASTAWVWSDKVLRAGMGAQFNLQFFSEDELLTVLARTPSATVRATSLLPQSVDLFDCRLDKPGVWVFGSEGQGVSGDWLARATQHVRIPQSNWVESLNVGSSSAVCLFEQIRQRR